MSAESKISAFLRRYQVFIGMGVIVVGSHIFWKKLQDNPSVTRNYDKKEYPWFEVKEIVFVLNSIINLNNLSPFQAQKAYEKRQAEMEAAAKEK